MKERWIYLPDLLMLKWSEY